MKGTNPLLLPTLQTGTYSLGLHPVYCRKKLQSLIKWFLYLFHIQEEAPFSFICDNTIKESFLICTSGVERINCGQWKSAGVCQCVWHPYTVYLYLIHWVKMTSDSNMKACHLLSQFPRCLVQFFNQRVQLVLINLNRSTRRPRACVFAFRLFQTGNSFCHVSSRY